MALGLGLGLQFGRVLGGGFDSDYQSVLNYATTQGYTLPSETQQILQNNLVLDLKSAGIWAKLDSFSVFATDGNSDFALVDWVRLTTQTAFNSPAFTPNLGFFGDGVSAYIETGFIPSTDGINYTLNDAARFFKIGTYTGNGTIDSNVSPNFNNSFTNASTKNAWKINTGANLPASVSGGTLQNKLYSISTDGNRTRIHENGVEIENQVISPAGIPTGNQTLFQIPTIGVFLNGNIQIYGLAANLDSQNADLNTAINNYIAAL